MIETLAAVTALALQIMFDLVVTVCGIVAWLARCLFEGSWRRMADYEGEMMQEELGRVYAADAALALSEETGLDMERVSVAVGEAMKRRNAIDRLVDMGISKTDAAAMVRAASKKGKV